MKFVVTRALLPVLAREKVRSMAASLHYAAAILPDIIAAVGKMHYSARSQDH